MDKKKPAGAGLLIWRLYWNIATVTPFSLHTYATSSSSSRTSSSPPDQPRKNIILLLLLNDTSPVACKTEMSLSLFTVLMVSIFIHGGFGGGFGVCRLRVRRQLSLPILLICTAKLSVYLISLRLNSGAGIIK